MRARRREINIFNMSLLDILCGALGAFCFMMLVALPYYIPPGSAPDLRKSQEETEKLMRDLEQMKERLPDQKSIDEMEDMLRRLEEQVKALQGQVNILTAEKEELKRQVDQLTNEKKTLQAQADQLTKEKNQLAQENQGLRARNEELEKENAEVKAQLQQRQPLLLMARADDEAQSIDMAMLSKSEVADAPSPFFQNWLTGQFESLTELQLALLRSRGIGFALLSRRPPGAELKLYLRLTTPETTRRTTDVQCVMLGDLRFDPPRKIGRVKLQPDRLWAFVGTLTIDKNSRPTFQEATAEEREAEWLRLSETTPTPIPSPSAPPTEEERAAAENTRAAYDARRRKLQETHKKFTRLMQIPMDESGKNDTEILQLSEEILRDLPPRDNLRREAEFRRDRVLEMKAHRERRSPSPNQKVSPPPVTPVPSPTS